MFLLFGRLLACLFVAVFCLGDILYSSYLRLNHLVLIERNRYGLSIERYNVAKYLKYCELNLTFL